MTCKLRIWTEAYRPFIMGGDCNAPIICEMPVDGPFDLGKGIRGFLAVSPHGQTFCVEAETGAIIGPTVASVRQDVEVADPAVMATQIAQAKERVLKACPVSPSEFWQLLRRARSEL